MTRAQLRKLPAYAGGMLLLIGLAACGHKPAPAPPAPPPPAAAPLPTVSLNANPTAIQRGETSTLTWTSDHAVSVTLNGTRVNLSGSQEVSPTESTDYEVVATNADGKAANASVRVTVTQPPPPPPPPAPVAESLSDQFQQNVRDAYFDYDRSAIRADAQQALTGDADWLKAHPNVDILIAGHCDARGSAEYNMGLGDRRADAARKFLIALGVDASRIRTISYGKEAIPGYPLCTASTSECFQQNRVDHISMEPSSGQ